MTGYLGTFESLHVEVSILTGTYMSVYTPRYEVYRGYIVFAFSVIMFVCLSVCLFVCKLFFRQRFLSNY